jgi:hypothetical protein
MNSRLAMASLASPSPTRASTSRSRSVSTPSRAAAGGSRAGRVANSASPTTRIWSQVSSSVRSPARASGWSSASRTLIGTSRAGSSRPVIPSRPSPDVLAQRQPRVNAESPLLPARLPTARRPPPPADRRRPLGHDYQPVPGRAGQRQRGRQQQRSAEPVEPPAAVGVAVVGRLGRFEHRDDPTTSTTPRSVAHGLRSHGRSRPGEVRAASAIDLASADVLTPAPYGPPEGAVIHPLG